MKIDFNPAKNEKNIRERGLSFDLAAEIDFDNAVIYPDTRHDYGEIRYIALCYLDKRLHVLVFTEIAQGIRVISFRKASNKEAKRHGKPKTLN